MPQLDDTGVSFTPYFDVPDDRMADFRDKIEEFMAATATEKGCLYYGFCFNGSQAICREAYADGDAFLEHLDNVGTLFEQAQEIAPLIRMELHGPAAELDKLREPLAQLDIEYFTLEYGFRR